MIRTLAILCLAAPAFGVLDTLPKCEKNLKVRFDADPLKAFMELPLTVEKAEDMGWKNTTKPKGPEGAEGFSSLVMYCVTCDYTICLLYDDNGDVVGLQIALNENQVTDVVYDWTIQGFIKWIVDDQIYWTTTIYFCSPEYLKIDAAVRKAARDKSTDLLQDKFIYVTGNYGKLQAISTNVSDIVDTEKSNFTEQACMPLMGHHYYYQMTKDLECNDELFKFFLLVYKGRLVGFGAALLYGIYTPKTNCTYHFENPPDFIVKKIVPRGPQCLYDLAKSPGLVTMHTYFISRPNDITCDSG